LRTALTREGCPPSARGVKAVSLHGTRSPADAGQRAPAATPRSVIEVTGKELARVLERPDLARQLLDQGVEARPNTPGEFTSFVRGKIEAIRQIATVAGIRIE